MAWLDFWKSQFQCTKNVLFENVIIAGNVVAWKIERNCGLWLPEKNLTCGMEVKNVVVNVDNF